MRKRIKMDEKINKLPKWAQEYIEKLERERNIAIQELDEYLNSQKESPFYVREFELGRFFNRYIQTHRMDVQHGDVHLSILLRENHIDLSWSNDESGSNEVAFIPTSFQAAKLVSKKNLWPPDKL